MKKIVLLLSLIFSFQILYAQAPAKPGIPMGPTTFCQGTTSSVYTSTGSPTATSYQWKVFPTPTAGNSSSTTTNGIINWVGFYYGVAKIVIIASNASGSTTSDTLFVTINPLPFKSGTPVGTSPICQNAINSNIVTSSSTYATSYLWYVIPSNAGTISGVSTIGNVNWDSAFSGIARIIVFGVNACGQGPVSDSIMITVNPLPLPPAIPTGASPLCIDAPNTIYSTAGSTYASSYQWYILPAAAGAITGTGLSGTVDWSATYTGIAKIFAKGINGCGSGNVSDTLFVNITPLPGKPAIPTGTSPVCQDAINTNFTTIGGTNATSYQWYILPASAGSISGTTTTGVVDWSAFFSGTAKIFVRGVSSCGSSVLASDTLFITVNPLPAKPGTPVGTSPICQGTVSSIIVTSGSTNATSFLWNLIPSTAGNITGTGTNATITWNSSFVGTVRVIAFGINGCGQGPVSDSLMITVNPLPLKPGIPVGTSPLCMDAPNTDYITTGSNFSNSYQWYILPSTAGVITGTGLTGTVDWNSSFSGIVKIFVKGVNTCGQGLASDTLFVTVNPLPGKPTIPTGTTTLCQNAINSNYTTTGGTNCSSYIWYILPSTAGNISGSTTTGVVDWDSTFSGIARIFVRGVNNCGNGPLASDSLFVTINPLPGKPAIPTGTSPVCQDAANTNYSTVGGTSSTTYLWAILPATAGVITGTTTTGVVNWDANFSGIAKIVVKGLNNCGQSIASDTLFVTVNPLPGKPAIPTGTSPLCQDAANANYTTIGGTNSLTYQWNILPATAGTITGTGLSGTVDWASAFNGIAKIFVKGVNACGQGPVSDTLFVTITPLPGKPAIPTGTSPLCQDAVNTNYTTTGGSNATTYQWYMLPAAAGNITGTTTTGVVDWSVTYSGIVKIFVLGINACGNGLLVSDTLFVTINPLTAKPSTPIGTSPICQDAVNSTFTTLGSLNATTYQWSIVPSTAGAISGTGTTSTVDWSATYSGTVKIVVIGINACGQGAVSDTLMVTINPLPLKPGIPTGASSLCMNAPNSTYTSTAGANATTYQWTILPATAGTISGTGLTGTVDWGSSFIGTAMIFVKGVNSCGSGVASDTIIVTLHLAPTINLGNDTTICTATGLVLSPGGSYNAYKWQDSSTTSTFIIPVDNPSSNVYWVRVTLDGCTGTDNITVVVVDCEILLEIPNVFTPNNDGINDVFEPGKRKGITKMSTSIYNRWGKLVYKSDDLQIGWDGKNNADGVYYWIINYTDMAEKTSNINGSLTLMRGNKP